MSDDFIKGFNYALEKVSNYKEYLKDNAGEQLLDKLILEVQTEVLDCAVANSKTSFEAEL